MTDTKPESKSPDLETLLAIEQQWIGRAKTQCIVPNKKVSRTYMNAEGEFFIGAMSALAAMGYDAVPPRWVMPIMSGQLIVSLDRLKA